MTVATKAKEQPIASWDECELTEAEVRDRIANWSDYYDNPPNEEDVRNAIYSDRDQWDMWWEDEMMWLTEVMQKAQKGNCWRAEVNNFGWRGLDGHALIQAATGQELVNKVLPKTDCTFYVYLRGRGFGRHLAINNFHHDSPVGKEWYYLYPCRPGAQKCEYCERR